MPEWSEKNAPLTPDMFSSHDMKKIIWKGPCGHEWVSPIHTRSLGHGCPYCVNEAVLPGFNDLASRYPDIAINWSNRNLPVTPDRIYYRTQKKYWWRCHICGNEYYRSPEIILRYQLNCPYCVGTKLAKGMNDLTITHPELTKEWDDEKNDGLTPDMYTKSSKKYIRWKCKYGHTFGLQIRERTKLGKNCFVCEAEYKVALPLFLVIRWMNSAGHKAMVGTKLCEMQVENLYEDVGLAFEHEYFSQQAKMLQLDKQAALREKGIHLEILPKAKDPPETVMQIKALMEKYGIQAQDEPDENNAREDFFRTKDRLLRENIQEREMDTMNEEMKLLLKLLLAQEGETEAGQRTPNKKKLAPEPVSGIDYPPEGKPQPRNEKEYRDNDFSNSRRELYPDHTNNVSSVKAVPIWEKYALTVPEAAAYFHIGETRLRKLIKKDHYANYLIWNGGRVFIKRKLFEEYLDGENDLS
ncbi:MAG: hypothetical protein HUJ72_00815 [Blautia sp.]|nr:hypothetical protein [Blautia sp.]